MRLRTFFVGAGDCLLLSTQEGNNVLVDGGPASTYFLDNVVPTLESIRNMNQQLDVVVVTHIDDDHIDGILQLLTLYQLQQDRPDLGLSIPPIGTLWHNSWGGPRTKRAKRAASQPQQPTRTRVAHTALGYAQRYRKSVVSALVDLNYSVPQAIKAAHLITQSRQPILRNDGFGGRLIALTHPPHVEKLSPTTSLTVLGPTAAALDDLKNIFAKAGAVSRQPRHDLRAADSEAKALGDERAQLAKIPAEHQTVREQPHAAKVSASVDQRDHLTKIGDQRKVTVPNRASLIMLATESGHHIPADHTCLLTGDATAQAILHGLRYAGHLTDTGPPFRCNVLKVQHHGAENNYTWRFSERVIAEHYVISANGQHDNPDPNVMRTMIEGRAATAPDHPFTVWFTCTPDRAPDASQAAMQAGVDAATTAAQHVNHRHPGLASIRVLKADAPYFDICMCTPGAQQKSCDCTPRDTVTEEPVAGRHRW